MSGGFAGGFAQGFSGTFGQTMNMMQQQRQLEFRREEAQRQGDQFDRSFDEQQRQFEMRHNLQSQQEERLREHQEWSRQAEEKKIEIQENLMHIENAKRLQQAFDPTLPRPVRNFILMETAARMGLPKDSPELKAKLKLFDAIDADTMNLVKTLMGDMPAREQTAIATGILNGQIEMGQVIDMAKEKMRQQSLQSVFGGGGQQGEGQEGQEGQQSEGLPGSSGMTTGNDTLDQVLAGVDALIMMGETGMAAQRMARIKTWMENSPEIQGHQGAMEAFRRRENEIAAAEGKAIGERQAPVEPRTLRFLGMDPSAPTSQQDLAQQGVVVPTPDQIESLQTAEAGVLRMNQTGAEIIRLMENKPETLGLSGSVVRSLESVGQQMGGIMRIFGVDQTQVNLDDSVLAQTAARVTEHLIGLGPDVAVDSAQIQSAVINLAYAAAAAEGLSGRAITNRDIDRMLVQIGQSQSPEQFTAITRAFIARQNTAFADRFEMLTGVRKQPPGFFVGDLRQMTNEDIDNLQLELLPDETLEDIKAMLEGNL